MKAPGKGVATALGVVVGGVVVLEPKVVAVVVVGVIVLGVARAVWSRGDDIAGFAWAGTAFTAPFSGVRVSRSVALSDVLLVAAVAAMLPSVAVRHRWSLATAHNGVLVGLAMIATGGLLGTLFAVSAEASLVQIAKFVLAAAGSIVAVRLWGPSPRKLRWFCLLWLGGAVVSSLWALTFSSTVVGRPLGLSTHPNHLGIVCLLATAMALGFALGSQTLPRRLGVAAFPPLLLALVTSGSRAALVGFLVMVPTVAVVSQRVKLALHAGAVAAVVAVVVLAGVVRVPANSGLGRLIGDGSTPGSNASRADHVSRNVERFERHPLTGEGFEFAQEAHNIYLQVLVAGGPLGLLGLVVVAGSVIGASRQALRASGARVSGDYAVLAGLTGGYVGYLVAGLFQNILWDRYLWLYIAATLALAASLRHAPVGALNGGAAGSDVTDRLPARPT